MKILYIEDNRVDIDLTLRQLKNDAPHIEVDVAMTQAEALKKIKAPIFSKYDLVLTDMHLQDGDGIAVLSHLRGHSIPVAVVLLTGQGDEQTAVAALKAGADDYVIKKKGYLDKLPIVLKNALKSYRQGNDRKSRPLKVLYLEHNRADVDLTLRHIKRYAPHIHIDALFSVLEFYTVLDNTDQLLNYDVLLLDYRLPRENALEILKRIRCSPFFSIPVILITGNGDEEIAVNALKLGAFDYVTKNQGYLFKLPSVIENADYSGRLEREHAALLESENRYRSLFENSSMVMLLFDPESGNIVDVNTAAVRFYGGSKEELTAKKIDAIDMSSIGEIRERFQAGRYENGKPFLSMSRCADGTLRDVEVYISPVDVAGRSLHHCIIYDVTERIKVRNEKENLQKQLIQAYKMEAIGQLAGGIAHDFNNILSSVIGFSQLALDDLEKGTPMEDYLQEIYKAGNRAKTLVRQILAFARKAEEKLEPVQVKPIVKEVLKFLRASIPVTIMIEQNIVSDAFIEGSATQVHQILMNLCTNAAHAMEDEGGIMGVSLKDVAIGESDAAKGLSIRPGDYVEIKVSDNGSGIPADIIGSIFDPYFTTKALGEGTGMGLAMVHGIVESYGGHISVDSTVGVGSVFRILLPVTGKCEELGSCETGDIPSGSERILFVDDEPAIAKIGSQILERLGYSVTTRNGSVEALALFRAKPNDFDLVITDMTMPNMAGDKLAAELIKIRPEIPIILCTGYSKKVSEETASNIGVRGFAYKPVIKEDLAKTVRNVLDEAMARGQGGSAFPGGHNRLR